MKRRFVEEEIADKKIVDVGIQLSAHVDGVENRDGALDNDQCTGRIT